MNDGWSSKTVIDQMIDQWRSRRRT